MVKNEAKKGGYQGNRSSGNQGWIPPTSELTNVTFNYGTRMKTEDFKRSVSLIAGVVAKSIKHGIKDVVKACNTGRAPTNVEPTEPAADASVRLQATYTYKMNRYPKELDQWEENNIKLYVRFMLHCSPSKPAMLSSLVSIEGEQCSINLTYNLLLFSSHWSSSFKYLFIL